MQTGSRRSRRFTLAALGLLGMAAVQAATKIELDEAPYKDPEYGYELKVFRRWDAIPTKPGEKADWTRAWGGEDGQRLEILVWADPAAGPGAEAARSGYDAPDGLDAVEQGFAEPPLEQALAARLAALAAQRAAAAALEEGEAREAALLACREGFKALLLEEIGALEKPAARMGLKRLYASEQAAASALDPRSPSFASSLVALRAGVHRGDGVPRHLVRRGVVLSGPLAQAPFSTGTLKGTRYEFASGALAASAYEFPLKGRTVALVYWAAMTDIKRAVPLFEASAKSFKASSKWVPGAAASTPEEGVAEADPRAAARAAARKSILGAPGWWHLETPRYILVTNMKEGSRFPRTVADQLEGIRDLYERLIPPMRPIEAVSIVRICKSQQEYLNYGAPPGSAGYWSSFHKELVLYGPESAGRVGEEKSLAVVRHEAFHQYIFYCMGDVAPHSWLNEGTGDFFSGAKPFQDGSRLRFVVGEFDWRNGIITEAIAAGRHVPLSEIVYYSQQQYYADPGLCYAEGWSLVYYLLKGTAPGSPYRRIIPAYLADLEVSKDPEQANKAAFDGIDLAALEKDWIAFYRNASLRQQVAKSDKVAPIMLPRKPAAEPQPGARPEAGG